MRYQIAQKLHACSDRHEPPEHVNDRARDVVDLLLLRDLTNLETHPTLGELRDACARVFEARAGDAVTLGRAVRRWPPVVVAHRHWTRDFATAAAAAGLELSLDDAVVAVNTWIRDIARSGSLAADVP